MSSVQKEYAGAQARYYDQYFTGIPGDSEFYVRLARQAGSPVLELGCGTGRIMVAAAAAGVDVVGIDNSIEMVLRARARISATATEASASVVQADMRGFAFRQRFNLVAIPYRTFQHLLEPQDQRLALTCIRDHLRPGGLLVLNIFEPSGLIATFGLEGESSAPKRDIGFTDPASGQRIEVWYTRTYDLEAQLMRQELTYLPVGGDGPLRQAQHCRLTLRYTYRHEMEELLETCGFDVKALYGDFDGSAFRGYGEQVWIAEKAD